MATADFSKAKADAGKAATEIAKVAQDAAYLALGLGVLGLQKAQVRRRELQEQLDTTNINLVVIRPDALAELRNEIVVVLKELDKTLNQLIERWDAAVDPMSERLPAGAQAAMKQAKGARDTLRSYLSNFAA